MGESKPLMKAAQMAIAERTQIGTSETTLAKK